MIKCVPEMGLYKNLVTEEKPLMQTKSHLGQSLQERNAAMLERLAPATEGAVQSGEGCEMSMLEAKAPAQKVKVLEIHSRDLLTQSKSV